MYTHICIYIYYICIYVYIHIYYICIYVYIFYHSMTGCMLRNSIEEDSVMMTENVSRNM
jgi:hypothetical protein